MVLIAKECSPPGWQPVAQLAAGHAFGPVVAASEDCVALVGGNAADFAAVVAAAVALAASQDVEVD